MHAFSRCSALKVIKLPDSLQIIGWGAFYECTSLEEINIPSSVTLIKDFAFCDCTSLKEITIPASVTLIKEIAFCDCSSLKSVIIKNPDCVIYDSGGTISNCSEVVNGKRQFYFSGTIYGAAGSTAQAYAEKYGYRFECI